jgi:mannosyl-oligosaccharide alpha-1,2-mannosidase
MLRIRRYRTFVIFSVIFSLAFLQFLRSRDWSSAAEPALVIDAKTPSRFAPGGSKDDSSSSHGFAPNSAWDKDKPGVESWGSKDGAGRIVNPLDSAALEKASRPAYNPDEASYGKGETVNQIAKTPHKSEEDSFGTKDPVKPGSKPLDSSDDEKPLKPNSLVPPETTEGSLAGSTTVQAPRPVKEEFGTEGRGRVEAKPFDSTRPAVHWKKLPEHFPVPTSDIIHLPTGQPKVLPKLQAKFKDESSTDKLRRVQRLSTIKEAFEHSWKGYKEHALGHDEVRPVSGGYRDPFAGWGATLVDALDTLWIMDLKEEFTVAVDEVKKIDFTTSMRTDIPLFETVIRYLGGLIGAYDISGHKYPGLLDKALELAEILIGAFDTPNRMPITYYNWAP